MESLQVVILAGNVYYILIDARCGFLICGQKLAKDGWLPTINGCIGVALDDPKFPSTDDKIFRLVRSIVVWYIL